MKLAGRGHYILIGLAVLVLAGCAGRHQREVAAASPSAGTRTGTILSARHVMLHTGGVRGSVLGALGVPANADRSLTPAREFIVREHGGGIISVMQPEPTALHPGERVRILHGMVTRLAPLDPAD